MSIKKSNKYIKATFPFGFNFDKYKNKNILIIGAGPTTNTVNWQNIKYDYIFTCNQYFECDKLNNTTVNIISLINRMFKTSNSIDLQNRLDKDNSYISIEPYHSSMVFNNTIYKELTTKYKNKCIFFDTTFQNKSGAAPRLAILATLLEPKCIYMVGIDGYGDMSNTPHAFDKNLKGIRDGNSAESINNAHIEFATYIHKLCNELEIKLYNLGEGHKSNISTKISKNNYPLTEELKKQLV
jgi:hypothetical protein